MRGGTGRTVRLKHGVLALLVVLLLTAVMSTAGAQPSGFSIHEGRLVDGHGNDFVMRGINHPHSWFESQIGAIGDIKATGANTVRVVLSTGDRFAQTSSGAVAEIVGRCRQQRLVCVLEVHDTTGYPDAAGSVSLDTAVDYWLSLEDELRGHEAYVIVNIGNEPFGTGHDDQWADATTTAVARMRAAGFAHTLMVDAPNWGQDWSFTMRDQAQHVFDQDPQRNLLFDIHMYGVFDDGIKVRSYIESFVRQGLPLVIGEFGATHTDGDPDEVSMMHWSAMYGIGYIGWSWSGNTAPVVDLNIARNFDGAQLTEWGTLLIDGPRGIASGAREVTVFDEPVAVAPPLLASPPVDHPPATTLEPVVKLGRVEAETSIQNGLQVALRGAGFSGDGYLTGFDARGDSVTMSVQTETAGLYDLVFGYRAAYGDKVQQLAVNHVRLGELTFASSPTFSTVTHAQVQLREGENTVTVEHSWGWFDLDFVEVWGPAG